jgi:hypothetical protein
MIQSRSGFSFTNKTHHPIFVFGKLGGQNLQSNLTVEFRVPSEINFAHSALTDFRDDAVMRQS